MSVSVSLTLPATPADGTIEYKPMGGDGRNAPLGAYWLNDVKVAGDASGGSATVTVIQDDRYATLIPWLNFEATVLADSDIGFRMFAGPMACITDNTTTIAAATVGSNVNACYLWRPPPYFIFGNDNESVQVRCPNTNGDSYSLSFVALLFDRNVLQITPLAPLLWATAST